MAASRVSHACSHCLQLFEQTRQCGMWSAWRAHSSPQLVHAAMHASSCGRLTFTSYSVCRESTRLVAPQMSAQSRFTRMHFTSDATSCSERQASAHCVQVLAHSTSASIA